MHLKNTRDDPGEDRPLHGELRNVVAAPWLVVIAVDLLPEGLGVAHWQYRRRRR